MQKRILIISGIYPPDIGGPATFVKELTEFLNAKRDKVRLITLQDNNSLKVDEKNIIKIPRSQNKLIRTLNLILKIRKNSKDVDSILCCGLIFETYLSQIGINKKKIYRFASDSIWDKYLSETNDIYHRPNNNYFLYLLFLLRNKILKSFNLIITPSKYLKEYYLKKIGKSNLKVISNFASINSIYFEQMSNHNNDYQNKINLVAISRLIKLKNIDYLIEAFKELPEFNLHIYGSGPEEKNYRLIIKRNKSKNIFLHGQKHRNEIYEALIKYDSFIQISSHEGMSFSILEALALNKPLILSNIEPNLETAKTAAIYVNPKSITQLRESVKLIKSSKIRYLLSQNAKKISSEFYKKEKSLELYYSEL